MILGFHLGMYKKLLHKLFATISFLRYPFFMLPQQLNNDWAKLLKKEFEKPYMKNLTSFLYEERKIATVYPQKKDVFRSFNLTPLNQLKVVIVGQDPYHGPHQAHGLAFSVPKGIKPPPSLKNVFKELYTDLKITLPKHGCLEKWAKQGVLLLNHTLTVREGIPRSHFGKGWENFTDTALKLISETCKDVIFVLWGKAAAEKCCFLEDDKQLILKAAHPSPYSATKFFGCKHFSKINNLLKKKDKEIIDWSLEE